MKKIFIAGAITNNPDYKDQFRTAATSLSRLGFIPLNPTLLPENLPYDDYFPVTFAMIDICDMVYVIPNSTESEGVKKELEYAKQKDKTILFTEEEIIENGQ